MTEIQRVADLVSEHKRTDGAFNPAISVKQIAILTNQDDSTVAKALARGNGPPARRFGRNVRSTLSDVINHYGLE